MDRDKIALTGDGFSISGIAAPFQKSGPLLVCIHGGSYTSRYFDIPGASLLDRAAANGISAVALDRPCYGGSSALKGEDVTFRHNADQLSAAVNELWKAPWTESLRRSTAWTLDWRRHCDDHKQPASTMAPSLVW